jgi:hypothetical protein
MTGECSAFETVRDREHKTPEKTFVFGRALATDESNHLGESKVFVVIFRKLEFFFVSQGVRMTIFSPVAVRVALAGPKKIRP